MGVHSPRLMVHVLLIETFSFLQKNSRHQFSLIRTCTYICDYTVWGNPITSRYGLGEGGGPVFVTFCYDNIEGGGATHPLLPNGKKNRKSQRIEKLQL